MQITEAIILAGGFGTRLQAAVPGIPKCLAPVHGRPFLYYLINQLRSEGIQKFIFSLGYKQELIRDYLHDQFDTLSYECIAEKEPLGTGGAILAACYKTTAENVLVVNGDTLYRISLLQAAGFHQENNATCTLMLKPGQSSHRYGSVVLNPDNSIKQFSEKKNNSPGLISGGYYLLNVKNFLEADLPEKFSFEKDFLERGLHMHPFYGIIQDKYFIDIGTPEDYQKVLEDLRRSPLALKTVERSWTLFLDRDGVINHERKDNYVLHWGDFEFYTGAREAIAIFSRVFGRIILVTNQRAVGKGLMREEELVEIHDKMTGAIQLADGRLDGIYYCPHADPFHPDRKPNPGMAFRAFRDFSDIDPARSIIAGNKETDMQFGRHAGIYTVFIASTHTGISLPHPDIDLIHPSLIDFAKAL